jgi:hypothetical protein
LTIQPRHHAVYTGCCFPEPPVPYGNPLRHGDFKCTSHGKKGKAVEVQVGGGRLRVSCDSLTCLCRQIEFRSRKELLQRWNARKEISRAQEQNEKGERKSQHNPSRLVVERRRTPVATLQLELVKCGKSACRVCGLLPAHGPYWYAYWKSDGRTRTKYIGKELPESFTVYEPDGARPGHYVEKSFAIPQSYVTSHQSKRKKLHKTAQRRRGTTT